MKHFFGYRADGALGSLHTYHGGWPDNMNLTDENSDVELVRKQRERLQKNRPDIVGFVAFNCACNHEQGVCECMAVAHKTKYAKDGVLVDKPTTCVAHIDGVPVSDRERLIRAPGTKLQFQVICPDIPDDQILSVSTRGAVIHPEEAHQLIISGGKTQVLEFTAPAQGAFGQVFYAGIQFIPARFDVVGFA